MLRAVKLSDSFEKTSGVVYLTGLQALLRLPIFQKERDRHAGLHTAGYISGYRGSPLGGYDMELVRHAERLRANDILFQPGINEDLAATAVWGTQQANSGPDARFARFDGVFSLWYGKGPGVDRSGDPFKHGVRNGTSENGGVLLAFGDDHAGKSSTTAHQSDTMIAANGIPVVFPATISETIEYGLYGWALSRFSGLWVGMKCVNETAEATASVRLPDTAFSYPVPQDVIMPPGGLNIRTNFDPLGEEEVHYRYRLPAASAFARMSPLDRTVVDSEKRSLGIVTTGKAFLDVMDALGLLGIDRSRAQALGLRVYKPGLVWPIEPEGLKDFCANHREILFVEEKTPVVEGQSASILYHLPADQRPAMSGKKTPQGEPLLPDYGVLDPLTVALAIGKRLSALGIDGADLQQKIDQLQAQSLALHRTMSSASPRSPWFCSGCPHNTSTKVPEGSTARSGIGCHTMALWMQRETTLPVQMGGEGAQWVGMAPFVSTQHTFQNLGDGTYNHSGLLAIRAAVAAKVNITYKILYNDAVAMTGGQKNDGDLSVEDLLRQVLAEKVTRAVIVTENPAAYRHVSLPPGVKCFHRDALDRVQRELRDTPGVTVLVYEQGCAAELRRQRKRGLAEEPNRRVFINELVCEGCGDCSAQSNCVSILPKRTEFGLKREIDQSSCNKDYSCLKGFCPSFVTVEGGRIKTTERVSSDDFLSGTVPPVAEPDLVGTANVLVAGIGGTGIVTVGAILGMAAHLEGKQFAAYDMTGLAQKGGAVYSHVRITQETDRMLSPRIAPGDANLLLGCDLSAASSGDALSTLGPQKTQVILNDFDSAPGTFQTQREAALSTDNPRAAIGQLSKNTVLSVPATKLAKQLLGDTIGTNMIVLGYAYQRGLLPVTGAAIEKAIEINGRAVSLNQDAFRLGRLMAHDPARFDDMLQVESGRTVEPRPDLRQLISQRSEFLTDYQNEDYSKKYQRLVDLASAAEKQATGSVGPFAEAVARNFFKVMAYKDEYEVARLYTGQHFKEQLAATFEGTSNLKIYMAPPLLARKDPSTGLPRTRAFGAWVFGVLKILASLKALRGSPFDPFGYMKERRAERALVITYEQQIREIVKNLSSTNIETALKIAKIPDMIRGYGHVKEQSMAAADVESRRLMKAFGEAQKADQGPMDGARSARVEETVGEDRPRKIAG